MIFRTVPLWAALGMTIAAISPDVAQAAQPSTGIVILQQLRSFASTGSVLYVAAHPDDENTQAITYFARGRGYRTAYLSLTRGDGGQNLLGAQLGEALGVARTQELLAARRVDGGRQYFTRAKDFGYSKSAEETLRVWNRQAVLGDIEVLHTREGLRIFQECRGDAASLEPPGRARRHRPRDPRVPPRRDHHPVFSQTRADARPSHGVRGAGGRSVHARRAPRGERERFDRQH